MNKNLILITPSRIPKKTYFFENLLLDHIRSMKDPKITILLPTLELK